MTAEAPESIVYIFYIKLRCCCKYEGNPLKELHRANGRHRYSKGAFFERAVYLQSLVKLAGDVRNNI